MMRFSRLACALAAATLLLGPVCLTAEENGAPTRRTGGNFPEEKSCADAMCHSNLNSGPGSVAIFLNGTPVEEVTDYAPNAVFDVVVRIAEASRERWGFQMTARSEDGCLQAGEFSVEDEGQVQISRNSATPEGCGGSTIEFPTHVFPITGEDMGEFSFRWTAPEAGFGQVRFAAAGNAANGNRMNTGDNIYTTEAAVAEGTGAGLPTPVIFSDGGVRHGASLDTTLGVAPSTFATVFGENLVTGVSDWSMEFESNFAPTRLGGAQVLVNGENAFIAFVGEGAELGTGFDQINFVLPDDEARGAVNVEVVTAGGTSEPFVVNLADVAPGFFPLEQDGRRHVAAVRNADGTFVGPADLFGEPNGAISPAAPGEVVSLFFTGGGPTTPPLEAGRLPATAGSVFEMTNDMRVLIGGMEAEVLFKGLSSGVALYQAVVRVPNAAAGLADVVGEINGVQTQEGIVMAIGEASAASR